MKKILAVLALVIVLGAVAAVIFWKVVEDPEYRVQEIVFAERFGRYDDLIRQSSKRYSVPPELIKAVIWRESRFHPDKTGQHGERGLMQITEGAASDWARVEKIEAFVPTNLFDPKVNIDAGAWYLKKALDHWAAKDDPVPFALAEYNAGRTRVKRWVNDSGLGETAGAGDLQTAMDFPATKSYIAAIIARQDFYERRSEFGSEAAAK
jgi:soluble lytic murein transglycosylase